MKGSAFNEDLLSNSPADTPVSRGGLYLERKASFLLRLPDPRFLRNNLSVYPEGSWEARVWFSIRTSEVAKNEAEVKAIESQK